MSQFSILINQINYVLPNGFSLFKDLNLSFSQRKVGLIGKNGIGKSTLLRLITRELSPFSGNIQIHGNLQYVPQQFNYPENSTIADYLGFAEKIKAFYKISNGSLDENDFATLNEDWLIEDNFKKQLTLFNLDKFSDHDLIENLSGGEITRLLLTKAFFSNADFLILDEPTNHLDKSTRIKLYESIQAWQGGLLIVSHDRTLLNLMEEIVELNTLGAIFYTGNYDDYEIQKNIEKQAHYLKLHDAKKQMEKTNQTVQASFEKHQHKQAYGKKLRKSGSIDKLSANSKKGRSERTQSKLLIKEERLIEQVTQQLKSAKENIEVCEEIHVHLPNTYVPMGKMILEIEDLTFSYDDKKNLFKYFNMNLQGPEKVALVGDNGSGKTTLIKLILNELTPKSGAVKLGVNEISYLDQQTSLLNTEESILQNFSRLNPETKEEDAHRYLAHFLFRNVAALKLVKDLSGGEKLRALLACVLMSSYPPKLLILDEPTNHLDLNSIKQIESALKNFQGAMIVISHDEIFLQNIGVEKKINMG